MIPLPANAHRFIGLIGIENCGAPSFPEPSPYFTLPSHLSLDAYATRTRQVIGNHILYSL